MNFYDVDPPVIFEAYNPVDWFLVDEYQTDKCIFPRGLQENLRQKKYIVLYDEPYLCCFVNLTCPAWIYSICPYAKPVYFYAISPFLGLIILAHATQLSFVKAKFLMHFEIVPRIFCS